MAELFDVELNLDDKPFDRARLEEAVARADVLVATLTDQVDADVIGKAGPQLKLIANFGNGVDHIDLKAARANGIVVTHNTGVLPDATAELTQALLLSVPRRLAEGVQRRVEGAGKGWSRTGG